jgi:hypothetical protein
MGAEFEISRRGSIDASRSIGIRSIKSPLAIKGREIDEAWRTVEKEAMHIIISKR